MSCTQWRHVYCEYSVSTLCILPLPCIYSQLMRQSCDEWTDSASLGKRGCLDIELMLDPTPSTWSHPRHLIIPPALDHTPDTRSHPLHLIPPPALDHTPGTWSYSRHFTPKTWSYPGTWSHPQHSIIPPVFWKVHYAEYSSFHNTGFCFYRMH